MHYGLVYGVDYTIKPFIQNNTVNSLYSDTGKMLLAVANKIEVVV